MAVALARITRGCHVPRWFPCITGIVDAIARAAIIVPCQRHSGRASSDGDGRGIGRAAAAFLIPVAVITILMRIVPRLPFGIARTRRFPGSALLDRPFALRLPIGGIGRLPSVVLCRPVQRLGSLEITRCRIGTLAGIAIVEWHTVWPINPDEFAPIIGVAAFRIGDVERLLGARLIIIVALALWELFDNAVATIVGTPHPWPRALIVDGVIRGCVAKGLAHGKGAIGVAIAIGIPSGCDTNWPLCRGQC